MQSKGILAQIQDRGLTYDSSKLTVKHLEDMFTTLTKSNPVKQTSIIFGGVWSKFKFDWSLLYGNTLSVKHWITRPKKLSNVLYISLFKKQGLYKLKVEDKTFTIYKGTEVLRIFQDVSNQWYLEMDAITSPLTQKRIDEVNIYLKKLEQHGE